MRLLIWGCALLSGLAVVFFAWVADAALETFARLTTHFSLWITLILAPVIGMLTVYLTTRFCRGAEGSGIPQVIAASHLVTQHTPINHLVSFRIALGKIALGGLALMGGFSAGREGPSVQVSASIMNLANRYLPPQQFIRHQDLILAGGAAGVAAAFNTPLAGIVFAIEELGNRVESRTSALLLSVIIISGLAAQSILGNYNYFGTPTISNTGWAIVMPVLCSGVLCGLFGGLFSWLLLWPQRAAKARLWVWRQHHPIIFAGLCGLIVSVIGILSAGVSFGSGYAITAQAIGGQIDLPWYTAISRYLATLVSYFSGIPGGLFAPSLATGAAIGSNLTPFFADVGTSAIMALCMAAFLSAVTQAPITSAIIVMEMINGHPMVISLMSVTLIAKLVSSRLSPELYQRLSLKWVTPLFSPHSNKTQSEISP